jgi:hypothetical protein
MRVLFTDLPRSRRSLKPVHCTRLLGVVTLGFKYLKKPAIWWALKHFSKCLLQARRDYGVGCVGILLRFPNAERTILTTCLIPDYEQSPRANERVRCHRLSPQAQGVRYMLCSLPKAKTPRVACDHNSRYWSSEDHANGIFFVDRGELWRAPLLARCFVSRARVRNC